MCPYFLDESSNWDLNMKSLESAFKLATDAGTNVKAIVIINPGNPTGQVLSKDTVADVVQFARRRGLAVLADEVYQENVYDAKKEFFSMYRGFVENPIPAGASEVPCFSFHSTSKGIIGECGRRGGFTHIANVEQKEVLPLYHKLTSVNLCSNITGQVLTDLMLNPPKEGEPSYPQYRDEWDAAMNSYKKRAKLLVDGLNTIPGIKSNPIEGAMYAFPQIQIPEKYKLLAEKKGVHPDFLWCMELLENERVVVVPGSGFEQEPGTSHFRTTILPTEKEMADVVDRVRRHQTRINEEYGPL
jgi:alanine transaminase